MALNEREVISLIASSLGRPKPGFWEIGDDLAIYEFDGVKVALKSDMLVWSTDVPKGMRPWQAMRKAIVMCVSDFSAKGVRPIGCVVSLGLPKGIDRGYVMELVKGMKIAREEFGVEIMGGDTNECSEPVIDCAMFGIAERFVPRGGARVGDLVFVSGPFGYPASGLKILLEGAKADERFERRAIDSVLMPVPRLELGIRLSEMGLMNSSIDSSDGLALSLWEIAERSGVGILIEDLPIGEGVEGFAHDNSLSLHDLVLYGGEEFEIVGTMSPDGADHALRLARDLGLDAMIIGRVVEGAGVKLLIDGEEIRMERRGWIHLK